MKKQPKAVKVIGIVLLALVVVWVGFAFVSHTAYHRSNTATIVEICFRALGTKDKFADEEECAEYIEQQRNGNCAMIKRKLFEEYQDKATVI